MAGRAGSRQEHTMKRYGNHSGGSGVVAYESMPEAIAVKFQDGRVYAYTYASTGRDHVEAMKLLAEKGRGLSTYIARHVQKAYAGKGT
jgi:hypothetical protein